MPQEKDNNFSIVFDKWFQGLSPTHFENPLTEYGNSGHASAMRNINILDPTHLTQGPGVSSLGSVSEPIKYILDKAVTDNVGYALGNTKLYQITATGLSVKRTITGATRGESLALLKGALYYFWQTNIGKYDLASTYDDDWGSTVPTGFASLQDAPHPSCVKEDLMVFGNGRYLGVYDQSADILYPTKLDFGQNHEVADVCFQGNKWWIAVNSPNLTGSNRSMGQIFIWDGAAISTLLEDEATTGPQRIGFLFPANGIIYVAYEDLSANDYKIGYISGSRLIPIGHYTGGLPLFHQKTLYKNTVLFAAGGYLYSLGSLVDELPIQISQIAQGTYTTTVGGIGAPFGTVFIGSDDGSNYALDKFSNYSIISNWTSIVVPISIDKRLGYIDEIVVWTNAFASGGKAQITLQYNGNSSNSSAQDVDTVDTRQHIISIDDSDIEDIRLYIDFSPGSQTIPVKIRRVIVLGHFLTR